MTHTVDLILPSNSFLCASQLPLLNPTLKLYTNDPPTHDWEIGGRSRKSAASGEKEAPTEQGLSLKH